RVEGTFALSPSNGERVGVKRLLSLFSLSPSDGERAGVRGLFSLFSLSPSDGERVGVRGAAGRYHFTIAQLLPLGIALLLFAGCRPAEKSSDVPEAKVSGDTVAMPKDSPQIAALTIESVPAAKPAFVPLTGRLVWDDDATVRVFTPFAGIVRKLLVEM